MMSHEDSNRNGRRDLPTQLEEYPELPSQQVPLPADGSTTSDDLEGVQTRPARFATRAAIKATERMSTKKLVLVGGGLAIAFLFFLFTVVTSKSSKKSMTAGKQLAQQSPQSDAKPAKGSVTPVMDTVRTPAPDNSSGQLGPGDIRRTRSSDGSSSSHGSTQPSARPSPSKPPSGSALGSVPSFSDTQQRWEEPQPYGTPASVSSGGGTPSLQSAQALLNALKEPSLVFVRSQVANQGMTASKTTSGADDFPTLDVRPGSRILANLESEISSMDPTTVVAVVQYTYVLGDQEVVPAGARVYGKIQQVDRNGYVDVKFDEVEVKGRRERIDAVGKGLDLGPIKGIVTGKNIGKNFLVRAASGMGSVLAEIAGNNSSAAFSENDMLRERLAENIGTAGDTEVMSLNANSHIVVSVPADTKIYIVFTKHAESTPELHRVASAAQ